MYTAVKSILFPQRSRHSRGESHVLKCSYIFHERFPNHFLATAASSRLVGGPPQTCTSHCVYSNVKSMPFQYHERNAPCMCACVHVCVFECVFKRAYMCKNIAFVCVFSIKHAHAFIMAKDVSLCVCMCSNGPVCVHSSIAKKEVCVCACMFEGVCVCI